ncbi:hypothetical protein HO173_006230 [Letharia columbiana]|uniref:Uncharacterized protein n=1 Tax=Letharia columbiana TaxID=112416 RepID=A0A8H6L4U2_9LECA|nr:uncharacterized protein HO173_006230 [Letharia columbiana]KAF6235547.1 hypothetical protein HO173_006230 [Letharia columbiana]
MAYIETPRTDAGNATFMTDGHDFENFSIEPSLLSPLKRKDDIVSQVQNGRGISLKTPRARVPLADRRNLPARTEFTPLLQSVAKKTLERKGKIGGAPETPAFLKASYQGGDSPGLPGGDVSGVYGSDLGSSVLGDGEGTPMPQVTSSSAQSTPLAVLPKRDAAGVLTDQGNMMTLREQENIINKIEKENFGLKLKIHFLEESLRKSGPGFNEAALKENTDLKVDKVTIQKELRQCRKNLSTVEREVEASKRHVEDLQEKAKRKHADETLRRQLEDLKSHLAAKESDLEDLRQRLECAEGDGQELEKLKGDIEDLEADLREKDRIIGERDDQIDKLKEQSRKDSDEFNEVCAELEASKTRIEDLEQEQEDSAQQAAKLREAHNELQDALEAKQKAEEDLDELRDEMSNKSINTKGLSRQLEDKANKLQDDLTSIREKHGQLQENFDDKSREASKLQEKLRDANQDADVREQRLKDQNELLRHEHESIVRKCESLTTKVEQAIKELQSRSEEKDLLHSRHDTLAAESQTLQKDLTRAQANVQELEESLEDERHHAQDNDRQLRSEAKRGIDRLSEEVDSLHRELEDKESQFATDQDHWESQRRGLQSQKERAEEQAAGLQRTISKLQETEGTLSGREMKLKEALESEKQRHKSEEAVLERQIQGLNADVDEKRQALDDLRSELSQAREDLRVSQREQTIFEEKVQALEDEVEVLQNGLDDEADKAREEMQAAEQQADDLRSSLTAAKKELAQVQDSNLERSGEAVNGLNTRLHAADEQLRQVKAEKQSLQDKLATVNLDLRALQSSSAKIEAERDEVRSQLEQMRSQVDETFKFDQEKLDLRTSKLKLENDIGRLREEKKGLIEKNAAVERELESEIQRATSDEGRLNEDILDLQRKLNAASGGRDRELAAARQKIQRLEVRVDELEGLTGKLEDNGETVAELSMTQKDLAKARKKEAEYIQREAAQKEGLRDLRQKVTRLERQSHEQEIARLTLDSPKSSVGDSARKNELFQVQHQLADASQQLREARAKSKDDLKTLQRKLTESECQVQSNLDAYEQQREQLEAELSAIRNEQDTILAKNTTATQTISRLRTRISSLENDVRGHRQATTADVTLAEERKDLHEMLKDAKLTAEDLQVQINSRESQLESVSIREKDLRAQLKRVREERTLQTHRSTALSTELENVQSRYERAVDNLTRQQHNWDEERKAMASRVRFANTSISSLHANDNQNLEMIQKKHMGELKGLAKQIQWLRAKCTREEGFRSGLVYEKKFLLMQIEMFEACNQIDLNLLSDMGITPSPSSPRLRLGDSLRGKLGKTEQTRLSLRAVGFMVMASCRMTRMSKEWAGQRRVRDALSKKLEGMMEAKKGKIVSSGR